MSEKKRWFLVEGESRNGPFSVPEVLSLLTQGRITENTLAWRRGMSQWKCLKEVPKLSRVLDRIPPPPTEDKQKARAPGEAEGSIRGLPGCKENSVVQDAVFARRTEDHVAPARSEASKDTEGTIGILSGIGWFLAFPIAAVVIGIPVALLGARGTLVAIIWMAGVIAVASYGRTHGTRSFSRYFWISMLLSPGLGFIVCFLENKERRMHEALSDRVERDHEGME